MKNATYSHKIGDTTRTLTWVRTDSLDGYTPITQVYGVCFDKKGNILVCRETSDKSWQIPGGSPEKGESPKETLAREVPEEVDVEVHDIHPLGVQRVDHPDNPYKDEGDLFYQARFVCKVKKINDQSPDPASGNTWERKFVAANKVTEYVKWGDIGEQMFKDAIELIDS